MIRNNVVYLLCGLLCLSTAACGASGVGRQQQPAAGQVEVTGNTESISENVDVTTTATSAPKTPAVEGTAAVPSETAAPETTLSEPAATETVVPETAVPETSPAAADDGVYTLNADETVALPACFDFDDGATLVPPDAACDFSMLPGPDSGTIEIYPQAGAQLAYGAVFPEVPSPAQCTASHAFSSDPEVVAPMAAMYVCYRTGEGRTGYVHFTGADLRQAGTVTFDWLTFAKEADGNHSVTDTSDYNYNNDTFGFRLSLPATWAGFEVTEHVSTENDLPDVGTVCFTFAGSQPLCVLKIDVWTQAAWNDLQIVPDGYYLAENGRYVFAAGPYHSECVQLDEFQCERRREVPAILAGFRVE